MSEIILGTHFKQEFSLIEQKEFELEGAIALNLMCDQSQFPVSLEASPVSSQVFQYLLNLRIIATVLANIFWNQIRTLIRQRVDYDREKFNYEMYRQRGMNDNRLLKNILLLPSVKGCKLLVGEFFKF